jgi:hypothetical protein
MSVAPLTPALSPWERSRPIAASEKRRAGVAGHARAPKTGCPLFSGPARDRSRASPKDCSAESARQRANSRSRRRSGQWRQARIASRSAGDGSAGRVSAKSRSGKHRLAPWPRFLGNSPYWCDRFRHPKWRFRRLGGLKGRWHPLRSRVRGAAPAHRMTDREQLVIHRRAAAMRSRCRHRAFRRSKAPPSGPCGATRQGALPVPRRT